MPRHAPCALHRLVQVAAIGLLSVAFAASCATTPTGPTGSGAPPAGAGLPPTASGPLPPQNVPQGPTAGQRAASAMEGLLMGAIIGGQAGPIGAAVGGVSMLIYSAVTGQVPFSSGPQPTSGGYPAPGSGPQTQREIDLEREIEAEIARQDSLEDQIEAELRRQEELLRQIESNDAIQQAEDAELASVRSPEEMADLADPRAAPSAPELRNLPATIFDEERRAMPPGPVSAPGREVVARSLDADRDGAPEEIRYEDPATGAVVRVDQDEDYDGAIDTWVAYESGLPSEIVRDTDGDGRPDEWETYGRDGRMAGREVDRNRDGSRDATYRYEGGSLVEERHQPDGSGSGLRTIHYQDREVVRTEEDTNGTGRIDTWTHYRTEGSREVVDRVEKDTTGDGRADTFETYEQVAGKPVLKQRNEDKNGDGEIDIKSYYEGGKLKSREISDPSLLPL